MRNVQCWKAVVGLCRLGYADSSLGVPRGAAKPRGGAGAVATAPLHVSFLEKLSKVAQRCDERAIREARARLCASSRLRRAGVRARKVKVEYFVPTPRSIGVHESAL
ncbi:jg27250 [Pararge aegeria aegeria]|uniref:Jg27250 protein n=1 Tax=Pararge aegeria aegeria TaxID=348720 RepID=A0A8S4RUM7_9NEOP|nr:jg27250 [Pararge aegeria aegeria]